MKVKVYDEVFFFYHISSQLLVVDVDIGSNMKHKKQQKLKEQQHFSMYSAQMFIDQSRVQPTINVHVETNLKKRT